MELDEKRPEAVGAKSTSTAIDVQEEDMVVDEEHMKSQNFLNKFGKVLPKIFCVGVFIILIFWIWGLAKNKDEIYLIWEMLLVSALCSLLGAWAVYRYGVIQDQIDRLKEENEKYQQEIDKLKETRERLGKEVSELQNIVHSLEQNAAELSEQAKQFDGLLQDLKKIAGDNADLSSIINQTNNIFNDMRKTVLENERAHLLSTYYECAFRDDNNGMDENEYRRFLGRLSQEQRKKFEAEGDFKKIAGDDNQIDIQEFQQLLEHVLRDIDEVLKAEFKQ